MRSILFDFTIYQGEVMFHGGGEYGHAILKKILELGFGNRLGIFYRCNRPINKRLLEECRKAGVKLHPIVELRNVTGIVYKYGYKTVYSALLSQEWKDVNLPLNINFIYTIHGMRLAELAADGFKAYVEGNELFFKDRKNDATRAAETYRSVFIKHREISTIITDSNHSKYSILRYINELQEDSVFVYYPPLKRSVIIKKNNLKVLEEIGVQKGAYGLFVSAGIWYKNAIQGLRAYDCLFDSDYNEIPNEYRVVVLGTDESILENIHNKDRFIVKGYVDEETLEILYKEAHLFLYPSLNEGFGYPPLEAMKYGTICACSANTSIPEICGNMVLYFNPLSIEEIVNRIMQSFNNGLRKKLQERIKEELPKVQKRQEKDLLEIVKLICGEKDDEE